MLTTGPRCWGAQLARAPAPGAGAPLRAARLAAAPSNLPDPHAYRSALANPFSSGRRGRGMALCRRFFTASADFL